MPSQGACGGGVGGACLDLTVYVDGGGDVDVVDTKGGRGKPLFVHRNAVVVLRHEGGHCDLGPYS